MRRVLPAVFIVLALAAAAPAGAQPDILNRPPMDLGADQTGVMQQMVNDMLYPHHEVDSWFEFGVSWPQGTLSDDQHWDAGLLLRGHHRFWRKDSFGLVGSFGVNFANDSYFNDSEEDLAFALGAGQSIQTRNYLAWPAMVNLEVAPSVGSSVKPFVSFGPGFVWSSEALITSAVNGGVGPTTTGSGIFADSMAIGPGGDQGISPYDIKTRTRFNLGWNARAGLGLKVGKGDRPLWARAVLSGVTYYEHTAPRTLIGITASLGR
jgi:opacity protein-like surface antigen